MNLIFRNDFFFVRLGFPSQFQLKTSFELRLRCSWGYRGAVTCRAQLFKIHLSWAGTQTAALFVSLHFERHGPFSMPAGQTGILPSRLGGIKCDTALPGSLAAVELKFCPNRTWTGVTSRNFMKRPRKINVIFHKKANSYVFLGCFHNGLAWIAAIQQEITLKGNNNNNK